MKKTEKIIAVQEFLSENEIDIEAFYAIRIDNYDIVLQGNFSDLASNVCNLKTELKVNSLGHATGEVIIPATPLGNDLIVTIVLT